MSTLLDVKDLSISFGGLHAVDDFNISIKKGQLYGLIGPNGAGKTTVFNLLTGVYKPDTGSILLDGKDITTLHAIDISKAGIARTFQNIRLFKNMTVLDNVKTGLHNEKEYAYTLAESLFHLGTYRKKEKLMDEKPKSEKKPPETRSRSKTLRRIGAGLLTALLIVLALLVFVFRDRLTGEGLRETFGKNASAELTDETYPEEDIWARCGEDSLRGLFLQELRERYDAAEEAEKDGILRAARFGLAALENRDL